MKKFLLVIALIVTTICLTACDCSGGRNKPTTFECSYWLQTRGITGLNMLKNDDGSDVFDYYKLLFYKDGTFELVFKIKDSEEEVYSGNYTDKDGVRSLYYENKPDEFQDLYGASLYNISEDGTVLTRKQYQVHPESFVQTIISQTFEIKK